MTPSLSDHFFIQTVGSVAACATTIAPLFQLIKMWRTRSVHDVSLGMYLLSCFGQIAWSIYGFLRHDTPIFLTGICAFLIIGAVILLKCINMMTQSN